MICKKPINRESGAGFTLIEILVVIFILAVLVLVSIPALDLFLKNSHVANGMQEFYTALTLAQSKTIASQDESQYGVYVDTGVSPHRYVIFKGATYATRLEAADQSFWLPKTVEFSEILLGSGNEVVFSKLTGYANPAGSVSVRLKADASKTKTVYISSAGILDFTAPAVVADTRVKDSRHVHVDYSRVIDTATESITMLFDGTVSQVIPIAVNMAGGQIYWTGTVAAGGSDQTVTVRTHRLNDADTQFSIHRDASMNNKSLRVTISGDSSGNLALYSADGLTTSFSSVYVSDLEWQ
ncbi:MAG: hypothetical protein A3A12_02665 [Candidatus Staskawiczbacteria bacterium RIFCSPLOWO2_01_FULL_43_17b]|nr:MAG: hypothetical protein A3A12_02665 [Candidatus Staskawiczbacteria bacterium RIFCSPLOWO2_01_FULL_43_17b]